VVNGDLTLQSGIANFHSLYVTGNLTVQSGGQMNATSLYVGKNFTVSGTGMTQSCGPTYVGGYVSWNSNASVLTTNYLDSSAPAGPLYVVGSFTSAGGPFNDVLGDTYVGGTVTFSGNNANISCPLLVTPSQVTTSDSGNFGTVTQPMVLLGLPGSGAAMNLGAHGTFTGLLINMGGGVNLNNDGNSQPPNNFSFFIDGAVMATGDVDFNNNGNVGYNPTPLQNLDLTATTTSTNVLPGTWQELSPSGNY
jgi:hypothetical protein